MSDTFHSRLDVPLLSSPIAIRCVLEGLQIFSQDQYYELAVKTLGEAGPISIKELICVVEMARREPLAEKMIEQLTRALKNLRG